MKYRVRITETYAYDKEIDCEDEVELQSILHEAMPLLVDMDKREIQHVRREGLDFKCEFEW